MKGEYPQIHIVAHTAFAHGTEINKCFEAGMTDYLGKPIKLEELEQILKKYGLFK